MKRNTSQRRGHRALLVAVSMGMLAALFTLIAAPANASGVVSASTSTTTVRAKNSYIDSGLMSAPSYFTGTITTIQYSLNPLPYPTGTGHHEYLCNATVGNCVDITGTSSGTKSTWSSRPISDQFYFEYVNLGSGSMLSWSITSQQLQIGYNGTP